MHHSMASLHQITACCLFGAKSLPEPVYSYCHLRCHEISVRYKLKDFSFAQMRMIVSSAASQLICSTPMCLNKNKLKVTIMKRFDISIKWWLETECVVANFFRGKFASSYLLWVSCHGHGWGYNVEVTTMRYVMQSATEDRSQHTSKCERYASSCGKLWNQERASRERILI